MVRHDDIIISKGNLLAKTILDFRKAPATANIRVLVASAGYCHYNGEKFIFVGYIATMGKNMTIVTVDERGRMTIPKEIGIRKMRAIVIPAGSFFVTIPLPKAPHEEAGQWLTTKEERKELKVSAERIAKEDAVKRAKRRNQI